MLHPSRRHALNRAFQSGTPAELGCLWVDALRQGQDPDDAMPEPLADDWHEAVRDGLTQWLIRRAGYVYVAAYLLHRDVFKVGQTALTPAARVRSLRTAGVLAPLELVHSTWTPDRHTVESRVHKALAAHRVQREFFQVPHDVVLAAVGQESLRESRVWDAAAAKLGGLPELERLRGVLAARCPDGQ